MTDIALVLQGGAALGAFEAGVIDVILKEKEWNPVVVSGVSIGAVNAAVLCAPLLAGDRDDAVDELRSLWKDIAAPLALPSFMAPRMFSPWWTPWGFWLNRSFGDSTPLKRTLQRHVDFTRLAPPAEVPERPGYGIDRRCIVTATNLVSGDLEAFDSGVMRLGPSHILASAALPFAYPPHEAEGSSGQMGTYVDGGLYNNTPLKQVLDALEEGPIKRVDLLVVVNLFPRGNELPSSLAEYSDRLFEIFFSNKTRLDAKHAERVKELVGLWTRIDEELEPELKETLREQFPGAFRYLDKEEAFGDVVQITHTAPEPAGGPTDFSSSSIDRRWEQGARAARDALVDYD